MTKYNIFKLTEDGEKQEKVESFIEAPAPARTLGARLQELEYKTGYPHKAELVKK